MKKQIFKTSLFLFITLLMFNFTSCNKDKTSNATISWHGEYEVDGCGFFITLDNHEYKPENESIIGDEFKNGSQSVIIEYKITNKIVESACGDLPESTKTDGIKIISIEKE